MVASEMVSPQQSPVSSRITSSQSDFGDWIEVADMIRNAFLPGFYAGADGGT